MVFTPDGAGGWASPTGVDATLTGDAATGFTLAFHRGRQRWVFTGDGWNTARADRNGNRLVRQARSGRFDSVVDAQQRVTGFTHAGGRLERVADPAGRVWAYRYDPAGRLDRVSNPDGTATGYGYDAAGRLTRITHPAGSVTTVGYQPDGRVATVTRVSDPTTGTGPTTTYTYAAVAGIPDDPSVVGRTVVTDPNGHATTHHHDAVGRVTRTVDALGRTRDTGYTANSDVNRGVAASGMTTTLTYSADGRHNLVGVDAGSGVGAGDPRLIEALAYADPAHPYDPTSHTNAQGHTSTYHYDPNGNRDSVTDATPEAGTSRVTYTAHGSVDLTTDPNGNVTDYTWTYAGPTGPIDRPDGPLQRLHVDQPDPLGDRTVTFDCLGRITSVTDGKQQTTTYAWTLGDRLARIGHADGSTVEYGHDPNGNRVTRTDHPAGGGTPATTSYQFDRLNRLERESFPDATTTTYGYDPVGNLVMLADAGGTVTYGYDAADQLVTLTEPGVPPRSGSPTTPTATAQASPTPTAWSRPPSPTAPGASGGSPAPAGRDAGRPRPRLPRPRHRAGHRAAAYAQRRARRTGHHLRLRPGRPAHLRRHHPRRRHPQRLLLRLRPGEQPHRADRRRHHHELPVQPGEPAGVRPCRSAATRALLVVGNPAAPDAGDTALRDRLAATLGASVTLRDDAAPADLVGVDVVVVTESVSSSTLGAKYADAPVGMVTMEKSSWDDQGLAAAGTPSESTASSVYVEDPADPLAAGPYGTLTDTVAHVTGAQKLGWVRGSNLGAGADRWAVALSVADGSKNVAFTYDAGATMAAGAAPARRVGLGYYSATVAALTADGWALFDNAVAYARAETGYRHDANGNLVGDTTGRTFAYNAADQTTAVSVPGLAP